MLQQKSKRVSNLIQHADNLSIYSFEVQFHATIVLCGVANAFIDFLVD